MIKIAKTLGIVLIAGAIMSYLVQPLILAVALPTGIFAMMIRKKKIKLLIISVATIFIIITIYISWLLRFADMQAVLPLIRYANYKAQGKYDTKNKKIELVEALGFPNVPKHKYGREKVSLSQFIATDILKDSTIANQSLTFIVFTSDFRNWLEGTGWKLDKVNSGNDLSDAILWLYKTREVHLNERWYRPKFKYVIRLPKSPFDFVRIEPLEKSELLLDMPKGMVKATSPPTENKSVGIDYERLRIPVEREYGIALELLSWPWRSKILISISKLIFWNPFMWLVGVLSAVFADKLKDIISGKLWEKTSKEKN